MYVRLGFSIAAHMEPDILLVDEVLAVGDAEFQVKCLQRIQELKDLGTTNLFISHDLTAIERLCDSAVLLESGSIAAAGSPGDVVASYHRRLTVAGPASGEAVDSIKTGVALTNLTLRDPTRPGSVSFMTGTPLEISLRYAASRALSNVEFELRYYSADGKTRLAAPRTGEKRETLELRPPGGVVQFTCDALPLKPGAYYVGAIVRDLTTSKILSWWDGETRLYVEAGPATDGVFYIPHEWRHVHADETESVASRVDS